MYRYLNLPEYASGVPMIIMPQWYVLNCMSSCQKLLNVLEKPWFVVATNFIQLQMWQKEVLKHIWNSRV